MSSAGRNASDGDADGPYCRMPTHRRIAAERECNGLKAPIETVVTASEPVGINH